MKIIARGKDRDHGPGTIYDGDMGEPKVTSEGLVQFQIDGRDKNDHASYIYTISLTDAEVDKLAKQAARIEYDQRLRELEKKFEAELKALKSLPELKGNYDWLGNLKKKEPQHRVISKSFPIKLPTNTAK